MNNHITISAPESLSFAWERFKENWKVLALISLITEGVSFILSFADSAITKPYMLDGDVSIFAKIGQVPNSIIAGSAGINFLAIVAGLFFCYKALKIAF